MSACPVPRNAVSQPASASSTDASYVTSEIQLDHLPSRSRSVSTLRFRHRCKLEALMHFPQDLVRGLKKPAPDEFHELQVVDASSAPKMRKSRIVKGQFLTREIYRHRSSARSPAAVIGWGSGVRSLCVFTALSNPNQNRSRHSQHEARNETHSRRFESERDSATYFFSR